MMHYAEKMTDRTAHDYRWRYFPVNASVIGHAVGWI